MTDATYRPAPALEVLAALADLLLDAPAPGAGTPAPLPAQDTRCVA